MYTYSVINAEIKIKLCKHNLNKVLKTKQNKTKNQYVMQLDKVRHVQGGMAVDYIMQLGAK